MSLKSRKGFNGTTAVIIPTDEHKDEAPRGFYSSRLTAAAALPIYFLFVFDGLLKLK